jgi:hypothetical protein
MLKHHRERGTDQKAKVRVTFQPKLRSIQWVAQRLGMKMRFLFVLALLTLLPLRAATVYSHPHNGSGAHCQSSVNGRDYDPLTWDMLRVTNATAITQVRWRGGYLHGGAFSGAAANWFSVTEPISVVGTNNEVILSLLTGARFFRLAHP